MINTTIGKELRRIRNEVKRSERYNKLKSKKYLAVDNNEIIEKMIAAAKNGDSAITLDAYEILNEEYHDIIKKDLRSSDKNYLINEVTEFFELEFEDVRISFVRDKISFSWW